MESGCSDVRMDSLRSGISAVFAVGVPLALVPFRFLLFLQLNFWVAHHTSHMHVGECSCCELQVASRPFRLHFALRHLCKVLCWNVLQFPENWGFVICSGATVETSGHFAKNQTKSQEHRWFGVLILICFCFCFSAFISHHALNLAAVEAMPSLNGVAGCTVLWLQRSCPLWRCQAHCAGVRRLNSPRCVTKKSFAIMSFPSVRSVLNLNNNRCYKNIKNIKMDVWRSYLLCSCNMVFFLFFYCPCQWLWNWSV